MATSDWTGAGQAGRRGLTDRLLFILWAGGAAFAAYFSMYAFRKPFTAASYAEVGDWGFAIDFKIALVVAQLAGYALSKFIGLKIVSEMGHQARAAAIIALIGLSWIALLLFAILPAAWKPAALFLNGLPLGMIWGLVFAYLEGRRLSDILGAMLCASFIVSSGMVKSVGAWLMVAFGLSEYWMPAAVGALFLPLLLLSVYGLSRLPPPDAVDIAERTRRAPMNAAQRRHFFMAYWPGLVPVFATYVIFTLIRDVRDNFAAEIWAELGYAEMPGVFTASEAPIALLLLIALASFVAIRDSRRALATLNAVVLAGAATAILSTLAFERQWIGPMLWMTLSGAGLYLAYTPFNAIYFDRLIAATGRTANAGFLIYIGDASGYLASAMLMLAKSFANLSADWLPFMIALNYWGAGISILFATMFAAYFSRRLNKSP